MFFGGIFLYSKKNMKFNLSYMNSTEYIRKKVERLKEIKDKVIEQKPQTVFEYNVIVNSVLGKDRAESRKRINEKILKK